MHAMRLAVVVVAFSSWAASYVHAQPPPCTPYLLCPYPGGTGGSGGRGGAGARAGTGGHAAVGGGGGQAGNVPAGGLTITTLELDRRVVTAGTTLHGSVTYRNDSSAPVTLREIRIAARAPGASHGGGPYTDLAPVLSNVTLAPGEQVTLDAQRGFTSADTHGQWEAYATHQDAAGAYHDQPSVRFAVVQSLRPPAPSGGFTLGAQEWFIASWAGTDIFKDGVDWANAYGRGDDIWNPQFLSELSGYVVFRHMDTNATNWSKITSWSQRKLPTDPDNQEVYIDGGSDSSTTGMAIEWQIDLCNRAHVDCWFTHPYLADDDYIRQEATLIKAKLNSSLKAYIELSNEVWNGSFSAYSQAISAGKAQGLPGSNDYYVGIAHEMYRALQMYQLYESVFGASAMGSRVIRVFSESGNLDLTTQALASVYTSDQWNPQHQAIDLLALAPYIGNGTSGASETLARWKSEVDSKVNGQPIAYSLEHHVQPYGIPLFGCYEAGMHHLESADAWARNPQAYDGYTYMFERFATKMNAPCALYTLHGSWDSGGAWGLYDHVGQAVSSAPKARAGRDWIASRTRASTTTRTIVLVVVLLVFVLLVWLLLHRLTLRARAAAAAPPPPPRADGDGP